jgi:hypothetical protein
MANLKKYKDKLTYEQLIKKPNRQKTTEEQFLDCINLPGCSWLRRFYPLLEEVN